MVVSGGEPSYPVDPMNNFKRFFRRNRNQICIGIVLAMTCVCFIYLKHGHLKRRRINTHEQAGNLKTIDNQDKVTKAQVPREDVKHYSARPFHILIDYSNTSIHHISKRHAASTNISMVLFSSWTHHSGKASKSRVYRNIVHNWKSFLPAIQPLVFTADNDVYTVTVQNEWFALPEKRNRKCAGPPLLPHMFVDTQTHLESFLYGFSNADILFSDNLKQTIDFFQSSSELRNQSLMIVGRRTNYDFHLHQADFISKEEVDQIVARKEQVKKSSDYFFTTKDFPWENVAPLSIGRPAFCRWIMSYAHKVGALVIDATLTISALHLTTEDGNKSSWHLSGNGVHCNEDVIENFPEKVILDLGWVECAIYETYFDKNGNVQLRQRNVRDPDCPEPYNKRKNI